MTDQRKNLRAAPAGRVQDRAGLYLGGFLDHKHETAGRQSIMRALRKTCRLAELDFADCVSDEQKVLVFLPVVDAAIMLHAAYSHTDPFLSKLKKRIEAAARGSRDASELDFKSGDPAILGRMVGSLDEAILQLNLHRFSSVVLRKLQSSLAQVSEGDKPDINLHGAQRHWKRYPVADDFFRACAIVLAEERPDLFDDIAASVQNRLGISLARMIENDKGSLVGDQVLERLIQTARNQYDKKGAEFLKSVIFSAP